MRLAEDLKDLGLNVLLDERELRVGDSLIESLTHAIDHVDFLIAVVSNSSVRSPWSKGR
jgi:hypothetical protein